MSEAVGSLPGQAAKPLHVAIVGSRGYPSTYGGFETMVRYLAEHLRDRGHRVTVYGRAQSLVSTSRCTADVDGVEVVTTPGLSTSSLSTLSHGYWAVRDCIRHSRPDVVVAVNVANGHFAKRLARARIPMAINIDGVEWQRAKWGPIAKAVFRSAARKAVKHAAELIGDAEAIVDIWEEQFGRRPVYLPYGAATVAGVSEQQIGELGLERGRYVLAVGRLVPENNLAILLDAHERMAASPKLVVVGDIASDTPLRRRLREHARRSDTVWLGHLDDQVLLHALWRYCGVYFHGHSVGGTNPALLQAMANGAPIVALDNPFSREVLGPRYPLSRSDPSSVADRIAELLGDEAERDQLGELGMRRVETLYRWDAVCAGYELLAQELTTAPHRRRRLRSMLSQRRGTPSRDSSSTARAPTAANR